MTKQKANGRVIRYQRTEVVARTRQAGMRISLIRDNSKTVPIGYEEDVSHESELTLSELGFIVSRGGKILFNQLKYHKLFLNETEINPGDDVERVLDWNSIEVIGEVLDIEDPTYQRY